jgi:general stress protein 26
MFVYVLEGLLMTEIQKVVLSLFSAKQTIYLATCDGLQPRLRPMTLIFYDNRFFIATSTSDAKTKQIHENPLAEILYILQKDKNKGYIRLSGTLKSITDTTLRKEAADFSGYIYDYWTNSNDPDYVLLEMIPKEAQLMQPGDQISQTILWENLI